MKRFLVLVLGGFMLGCGGDIEASSNMTLTVNPSSVTLTDTSPVLSTSTENFQASVLTSNGKPAIGVKVYASVDAFFVSNGLVWFPDCPGTNLCSCSVGSSGRCSIRVSYQHGGGLNYTVDVSFFSGPLFQKVTIEVKNQ